MLRDIAVGLCVVGGLLFSNLCYSQSDIIGREFNPIRVAAPFLTIAPDSRAAGYGDQGVASAPDNSSQFWNPAKYMFTNTKGGVSLSYTPWLNNVISGISLNYLSGYVKFGDKQAISASIRYFALGDVELTDNSNTPQKQFKPNEFAIDAAYSRKLSDALSTAIAFRYISSNISDGLVQNTIETKKGSSVAADIALYYSKPIRLGYNDAELAFGLSISNIGSKISYSNDPNNKSFLPTMLRFGGRYTVTTNRVHKLSGLLEVSKLLVPTPKYDENGTNINASKTTLSGIFGSFMDAPNGMKEELQEVMFSIGADYCFNNTFSVRAGTFIESKNKGNRNYFTVGTGLKLNLFVVDVAYLIPSTNGADSPLAKTFRITVGAEFGQDKYGRSSRGGRKRYR